MVGDLSIRTTATTCCHCPPSLPRSCVEGQTCFQLTSWTVSQDILWRCNLSVSRLTSLAPQQTHSSLWAPWGKWPTPHLVTIQKPESLPPSSTSSHGLSSFLSQHPLGRPSSPSSPPPWPTSSSLPRTGLLVSRFSPAPKHLTREPPHLESALVICRCSRKAKVRRPRPSAVWRLPFQPL